MSSIVRDVKPRRRPKKTPVEKARRQAVQKRRLAALGVAEDVVSTMPPDKVRTMLRHPAKVVSRVP